jgi:MFS family permease
MFVRTERRATHPLLPPAFFRRRNFTAPLVAQFGSNFAYMGGFIVTPFLMQDLFGYSLRATGYVMLCRPLTFSIFAPIAGYLTVRVVERRAAVAGTVAVLASMGLFAVASDAGAVPLVVAGLVLSGLGLGASSPALVSSVANTVGEGDLGVANAAQATVTQIGVVAGIQLMSAIQETGTGSGAFVGAYLLGGVLAAVGVAGAAFVRNAPRRRALRVAEAA